MSDTGSDHDDLRPSKSKESTSNTELSTDGAVSLFSTVLTNALEQQKVNLIKHFENQFIQPVRSTGVSTPDFVFKREDDAANLRSAIASASRKRKSSKPYDRPSNKPTESGNKFNAKNFFVGLVKAVDSEKIQVSRRTDPGNASIAINKDISPDSVHSRQVRQQQSARPQRNKESHSKEPTLDEDTTNGVEYNFDFINNYEIKSGDQVINVKGNLKHNVSFWKSVLQANDFIVNTIEFGYRIPFNIEPCCIYLPNNKSALKHALLLKKQ
ncbi:Hypothetical predicted protein [Mytilus galloprovincialis]|uniref:Uncharacterized protein n=1 Tax=Mytilus galloprovincialis TaxID=29158 RepID=A0A8B6DE52_MYTGA|nr:Hypothetical predicted protein [Mytilus galloprovincialis]